MSDLDKSGVTFTEVSSPFEDLSDIGSPRVDDHEYLELPWMPEDPYVEAALQAPPSPDYVPGPEEPEQAPPSPDYVPSPKHTDNEIDPVDYPTDGGDDEDNEDEPLEEDEDDDGADDDEEEEEHLAPADSVVVALPATDQAPSAGGDRVRLQTSCVISIPPSSSLSPMVLPLPIYLLHHFHYHTSPVLSPTHLLAPIHSLGVSSCSDSAEREDRPEVTLPPQKRLGIALGPRYEVGESSSAAAARPARGLRADYGFVATMDREIRSDPERGWIWDHRTCRVI
ncbi:hypothetical protein Tco_0628743 [Tanacetum coccineum]|uniref:Uncharacterized protein n=1 Tax=Tanacetum coccineum TaxID=301880 RepID=A0ABQ4WRY2_9ASTR